MNCKFCKEELKGRANSYLGLVCMSYKNDHRFSLQTTPEHVEVLSFKSDAYEIEICNSFTKSSFSIWVKNGFNWDKHYFDKPIIMSNSLNYYLNLIDNLKCLG